MEIQELINNVRRWGIDKKITGPEGKGTLLGQLTKTQEELTETRDAAAIADYLYPDGCVPSGTLRNKLKDGIGDTTVTLILEAEIAGLTFEECLQYAYDEIKGRTGKMVNGTFVKDTPAKPATPTTIKEWLETLPDGYRERALANMYKTHSAYECDNLEAAIGSAFLWSGAPEGNDFWGQMQEWADSESLAPLPALPETQTAA